MRATKSSAAPSARWRKSLPLWRRRGKPSASPRPSCAAGCRLESQLGQALERGIGAERRLTETQRRLEALRNQRESLVSVRDQLNEEVGALLDRIAAIESSQQTIVQRLAERTRVGADEVEKTVAMTGLDVDALLQKVTIGLTGLGGPFVPADRRLPSGEAQTSCQRRPLDLEMSGGKSSSDPAVDAAQRAPRSYTIGSPFGTRKDRSTASWQCMRGWISAPPWARRCWRPLPEKWYSPAAMAATADGRNRPWLRHSHAIRASEVDSGRGRADRGVS